MDLSQSHIAYLLLKDAAGQLSPEEAADLEKWKQRSGITHEELKELNNLSNLQKRGKEYEEAHRRAKQISVPVVMAVHPPADEESSDQQASGVHFLRRSWLRYAAAAILLVGSTIAIVVSSNKRSIKSGTDLSKIVAPADMPPGGNKAILTLGNDSTIVLDDIQNGTIATQGNSSIIKFSNGEIRYAPKGISNGEPVTMNTMTTPRGGTYKLILPDGSTVWLNAESSIKYPVTFSDKERVVSITGEIYFEIKPNPEKPFIVKTYKEEIIVLGTSFNVNSYTDEPAVKASLLEGAIKINGKLLKPGDAYQDGKIIKTDLEQDIAWKNGLFFFNETDLPAVLRQISRWYDLDIVYKKDVADRLFGGKLGRDLSLSQILKILDRMKITYQLEGRKLTIG